MTRRGQLRNGGAGQGGQGVGGSGGPAQDAVIIPAAPGTRAWRQEHVTMGYYHNTSGAKYLTLLIVAFNSPLLGQFGLSQLSQIHLLLFHLFLSQFQHSGGAKDILS